MKRLLMAGAVLVAATPVTLRAQAPAGSEFQVNAYTTGDQRDSSVAVDGSGNFVIVWASYGQDGSDTGIVGRRFSAAGAALGSEFQINTYTSNSQYRPSVASDANGNFVVVWESAGEDGSGRGIFGQRFSWSGAPQGAEFRVNTSTVTDQVSPRVVSDASGNFMVAWTSYGGQDGSGSGVFGQRFDASGVAQGGEFQINSFTLNDQKEPALSVDGSGNFVVVWTSNLQDGSYQGVFGQRFDASGAPGCRVPGQFVHLGRPGRYRHRG